MGKSDVSLFFLASGRDGQLPSLVIRATNLRNGEVVETRRRYPLKCCWGCCKGLPSHIEANDSRVVVIYNSSSHQRPQLSLPVS